MTLMRLKLFYLKCESHFFSTKSISETQKELDFLGFKANDEFTSFCREHDTSFYYPKDN